MPAKSIYILLFGVCALTITLGKTAIAQTTTAKIAVGASQSLVLNEKGEVFTFCSGIYGELGHGGENRMDIAQAITHPTLAGKTITDVSLGETHMLVLTSDGEIYGWGSGVDYELGTSNKSVLSYYDPVLVSGAALDTATIVNVYAGNRFSMFLSENGTLFAIGHNIHGLLGTGSIYTPISAITPVDRTNMAGEKIVKVRISRSNTLLITESNKVFGFGSNVFGELGKGDTQSASIPVEIPAQPFLNKTIIDIAMSEHVSMFLASDGTLFTCGNRYGGLGHGALVANLTTPTAVTSGLDGKSISSIASLSIINYYGNIAIAADGSVFVSGEYALRRHGLADQDTAFVQVPPSQFDNKPIVEAAIGLDMSLFRASDGTLFGAGENAGTGYNVETMRVLPLDTTYLQEKTIAKILTTSNSGALLASDGTLFWFRGDKSIYLSFENAGTVTPRNLRMIKDTPAKLTHSNLSGYSISDVKAGGQTSYLLTSEGKVFSFGNGQFGTLGNGDSLDVDIPTLITHANLAGKKIVDIAISGNNTADAITSSHALLLADDGTLFAMGSNAYGQLGLGDSLNRFVPTPIITNLSGKTITKIAVGGLNSMAIASDGSVFLWGNGGAGEMGFGNTNNLNVPTLAAHANVGGKKIIDGAVGYRFSLDSRAHFLVLSEDHTLYSFGENNDGQLGQGNKTDNYIPTQVLDTMLTGETIVGVQAGFHTSLLLTQSGKLFGWGQARKLGFNVSTLTDYIEPTLLESDDLDGRKVLAARAHANHGLALYDDGTVLGFGTYSSAQNAGVLGNGPTSGDGTNSGDYSGQQLPAKIAGFSTYETPLPATSLVLHLDAARLGYSTSNDSVTTWNNLTGSGFNAAQGELAIRPLLADSAINNHPALRFNGTNTYFSLPTSTNLGIQSSDYEVFIVAKSATSHSNTEFLLAGSIEQYELHVNGAAGARFIPIGSTYIDKGSSGDYTDATAQLYNVRATSTQAVMSVNRKATVSSVNAQSSDAGTLYLGVRGNSSLFLNGDIAEVIIYDEVLSDNDRRAVESYLFKKYAIQNYKESSQKLTGAEGWRIMTSPVADSSFAPLLGSFWTQGFTSANHSGGASNVYRWPNSSTNLSNTNWTSVSNMSDSLHPGEGVLVYVYSDDNGPGVEGNAGFPKTLKIEGREPEGTQSLSSLLNANINGWALVGNPFRNDVDWDGFTRSGLSNSVYVYDINSASWKSWNGTLGSLTDGEVGPFNAFFVQTKEAGPSLEIPESAKTDSAKRFLGKQLIKSETTYFSLELKSDSGFTNKTWFQFSEDGEFGIDASDAHQLNPLSSNYVTLASILNDTTHLDINSLPLIKEPFEIPLVLQPSASGTTHRISKGDLNIPEGWEVSLYDSELDITSNLEESYVFMMNTAKVKTQDIASTQHINSPPSLESVFKTAREKKSGSRFILTVSPSQAVSNEPVIDLPTKVELGQNYPNPFNPSTTISFGIPQTEKVTLEVFDILGRKVATLLNGENKTAGRYTLNFNASNLASGMYIYRLRAGNVVMIKKFTLIK